jgi:hypothetical protein
MKTAFFPQKTLVQLPADNAEALAGICTEFERFDGHARELPDHHDDYVETLSILRAFARAREANLESFPEIGPQRRQNILNIKAYFAQLRSLVRSQLAERHAKSYFDSKTEEYLLLFARVPVYEFAGQEFTRVQDLFRELADLLRASTLVSDDQKNRLLRKLEAARAELHRKTTDIDRFWGFLAEAAIAMRKFGQDFKPVSDRVLELAAVVTNAIFKKEGITALPDLERVLVPETPNPNGLD